MEVLLLPNMTVRLVFAMLIFFPMTFQGKVCISFIF